MNDHERADENTTHIVDVKLSLGFSVHAAGGDDSTSIVDVIPGSPAALAGLAPAMKLIAVNKRRWSPETLREAIRAAKNSKEPIELLAENDDYFHTYALDYHDGERYPHLVSIAGPDLLSAIAKRRAAEVGK
jgi:predicted metalloprotease with PDZ domain